MTLRALAEARSSADERLSWVYDLIERTTADGYRLTTVLEDDYPVNLRLVQNSCHRFSSIWANYIRMMLTQWRLWVRESQASKA